jgi:DNA (cytosine-5)-methyltransferase 1
METSKPRRFTGPWGLADLKQVSSNGLTAFSCFHCGGGSTMGYKLAGFQVLGGVEIDPEMMAIYRANHKPKHSYLMGVQQFNKLPLDEIPDELKNLDLLDGSPPCSSFSMAGSRVKKWGDAHHFREGQVKQVLDDLFFHFIEVGQRLQPKVIVAENVKGLILGNAKGYVKEIFAAFKEAGYDAQLFLFNAARMGVPQARERTFFIARRQNLGWGNLTMGFEEQPISVREAWEGLSGQQAKSIKGEMLDAWKWCKSEDRKFIYEYFTMHLKTKKKLFNHGRIRWWQPSLTVTSTQDLLHPSEPRHLSSKEITRLQSFPDDYDFSKLSTKYVCGMSVPPFMTQRVALEIGRQWYGVEYE